MIWWILWLVLVLVALGVLALVGLRLWRSGKALMTEASAVGALADRFASAETTPPVPAPHVPGVVGDPATLEAARAARARLAAERTVARERRLADAKARWRAQGLIG